jgi:hypothetical protein
VLKPKIEDEMRHVCVAREGEELIMHHQSCYSAQGCACLFLKIRGRLGNGHGMLGGKGKGGKEVGRKTEKEKEGT